MLVTFTHRFVVSLICDGSVTTQNLAFLKLKNKNQLDATYYFIVLLIGSTCFGHYYAHHRELATIILITTLVVSFLVCFWILCLLDSASLWHLKNKNQLDSTYYIIVLLIGSTCFGHYCAHHQELATIMLITTLDVSFCKDGGGRVNVKLCFLVVYVRFEVLCRLVVAGNVFLLILIVVILCVWWVSLIDTTPPQPNHNVTPTHIEPEQYNPWNNTIN